MYLHWFFSYFNLFSKIIIQKTMSFLLLDERSWKSLDRHLFGSSNFLFSSLSIVVVYITILAHSSGVEFWMTAVPWLLCSSEFVVAIVAHSFSVVGFVFMTAFIYSFTKLRLKAYVFLTGFMGYLSFFSA